MDIIKIFYGFKYFFYVTTIRFWIIISRFINTRFVSRISRRILLNIISKVCCQLAVQYLKFRVHGLPKTFSLQKSSSYLLYTVCITVPYLALTMGFYLSPVGSLNPFKWPEWDRTYVGMVLTQTHWYTYIIYIKYLACVCE